MLYNKKDDLVIGIVGGMGSYATVHFFKCIIDAFPAEKEWERPRIIIDNKCTMPSRVRAVLYGENKEILIKELTESVDALIQAGATKIILACNTSHCFLEDIIKNIPIAGDKIINIIEACAQNMYRKKVKKAYLLATEGTILSGIYSDILGKYDIRCETPKESDFSILRDFIESVKQNDINSDIKRIFAEYVNNVNESNIILGCTELPILYHSVINDDSSIKIEKNIFDPLDTVIEILKDK